MPSGISATEGAPAARPNALALAEQHRNAGRLAEAQALCEAVLKDRPQEAQVSLFLSLIAHRAGKLGEAIDRIGDAVSPAPGVALFRVNLGEMCRAAGRTDGAIAQLCRALELDPINPAGLDNLGIALCERSALAEALTCYHRCAGTRASRRRLTEHLQRSGSEPHQAEQENEMVDQIKQGAVAGADPKLVEMPSPWQRGHG